MAIQIMKLPPDRQAQLRVSRRALAPGGAAEQLWVPQILYAATAVADGAVGYFPNIATDTINDDIVNKTPGPMLIRSLTNYFGSLVSGRNVKLGIQKADGRREYIHRPGALINDFMVSNGMSLGETRAAAGTGEVFRLWKPYRLLRHESLVVRVGSSANGGEFTSSLGECAHAFHGVGVRTGNPYVFGYRVASGDPYTWAHENVYDEDIDIHSLTLMGQAQFQLAHVEPSMGQKWSRAERDWYLLGSAFPSGRLVFDFLPDGALVLEPGDSLFGELQNASGSAWTFRLMVEAYVLREVPT